MLKEILIFSDLESTKNIFKEHFSEKYNISFYQSECSAIDDNRKSFFDYIFVDLAFLKKCEETPITKDTLNKTFLPLIDYFPEAKKIIMADRRYIQDCILAVKLGIDSYIQYPLIVDEIQYVMDLIYERIKTQSEIEHLEETTPKTPQKYHISPKSSSMLPVLDKVKSVAITNSTVLITGESGTGKSVLAKQIHKLSKRKNKKFISVHCGALPESLISSELFGHEKGSFTGAIKRKIGRFELANGGTIFLDEIGTLSEATQIRLLQVLQERFIQRVGGEVNIPINIRIIAATNSSLEELVASKTFREDLFYRLNVFQIEIPPLRKRREDIEVLGNSILKKFDDLYGKNIKCLSTEVLETFWEYSWPGNIRELENLLERAYVLEKTEMITSKNIPLEIFNKSEQFNKNPSGSKSLVLSVARKVAMDAFENKYLQELLAKSHGNLKDSAKISEVSVRQLHKMISKHNINRKSFL